MPTQKHRITFVPDRDIRRWWNSMDRGVRTGRMNELLRSAISLSQNKPLYDRIAQLERDVALLLNTIEPEK